MPLNLKTDISNSGPLQKAARRRVSDSAFNSLTEEQIQDLAGKYVDSQHRMIEPLFVPGSTIASTIHREYLKDMKFYISLSNEQLGDMEREVHNASASFFSFLNSIQQEALELNAFVTEEEIKLLQYYDQVHFNSFSGRNARGMQEGLSDWLYDYKTQLPLLGSNIANVIAGTGVTLPLRQRIDVAAIDAILLHEETDIGDTVYPLQSTSPRNLLLDNRVFRHVVMRLENDETVRIYNYVPSYLTVQLELPNLQLINRMVISPAGQNVLEIEELSYINEAGEKVILSSLNVSVETNIVLLFEPIRTRYIAVKFKQNAPVTKSQITLGDQRVAEINKLLEGLGWDSRLDGTLEVLNGRVFDFTLESIRVGLNIYEPLGMYRSNPQRIRFPAGMSIESSAITIEPMNTQGDYFSQFSIGDASVQHEYYLGLKLYDHNGSLQKDELIPIADSYPIQKEFLPIVGGESRVKLFPDLLWDTNKIKVAVITKLVNPEIQIDFDTKHNLVLGESFSLIGSLEHPVNASYVVKSLVSDYSIIVDSANYSAALGVTANTSPYVYLYYISQDTSAPFTVTENGVLLTVGTHYQISLDGGNTWLNSIPYDSTYIQLLRLARAGRCRVKILSPKYDRIYIVEYRPLNKQRLSVDNSIWLDSGRVVFGPEYAASLGTVSTVLLSRADSKSPMLTPITLFYALKVRQHVK